MSKQALRSLRDDEQQSPVGREILQKFISGEELRLHATRPQTSSADQPFQDRESKNG